jgi:hypothetical protein
MKYTALSIYLPGKLIATMLDAIAAAISKQKTYPYPAPPLFTDVTKRNFEGFALNLPMVK